MRITELFDPVNTQSIDWINDDTAIAEIGDKTLRVNFHEAGGLVNLEFSIDDEFQMTGRGGVDKIFATVIQAVKEYVEMWPGVHTFVFTADEKSRARMYDVITKRVSKQLGWHVIPYDEMVADERFQDVIGHGAFTFAIEKGAAPAHRQDAQKPQHGEFLTVYYVYNLQFPELPAIKIKAKHGYEAETWVQNNIPEYKGTTQGGMISTKLPPKDRTIVDKGTMPVTVKPPQPAQPAPGSLGATLRAKLGEPK